MSRAVLVPHTRTRISCLWLTSATARRTLILLEHDDHSCTFRPHDRQSDDDRAIMATELTVQSERAYQKQPHIFLNAKSTKKSTYTKNKAGVRRWYKDVGLGFRTPKAAIEGSYIGTSSRSESQSSDWHIPIEDGGLRMQDQRLTITQTRSAPSPGSSRSVAVS